MEAQMKMIGEYAKKTLQGDTTGHSYAHVQRVVRIAQKIMKSEVADPQIVVGAALLHDVYDDKVCDNPKEKKKETVQVLKRTGFSEEKINQLIDIIDHMSFSANLDHQYHLTKEGQIVQDADRLDAIGAIGIARAFQYGGAHHRKMYDSAIKPRRFKNKKEYRSGNDDTTINHFYEKLFKIPEQLNTDTAKKMGQQRKQFMEEFVKRFKDEWEN